MGGEALERTAPLEEHGNPRPGEHGSLDCPAFEQNLPCLGRFEMTCRSCAPNPAIYPPLHLLMA